MYNEDYFKKIGKELPYSCPENYLRDFEDSICQEIKFVQFSNRKKMIRYWSFSAAAVLCLSLLTTWIIYKTSDPDFKTYINQASTQDLSEWIAQYEHDRYYFTDN